MKRSMLRANMLRPATSVVGLLVFVVILAGCFSGLPGGPPLSEKGPITFSGTVYDADGTPVRGATITIAGHTTRSDDNGRYVMENVEPLPANTTVTVEAAGFTTYEEPVFPGGDQLVELNFVLYPAAARGDGNVDVGIRLVNGAPRGARTTLQSAPPVGPTRPTSVVRATDVDAFVPGEWIVELDEPHGTRTIRVDGTETESGLRLTPLADNFYLVQADDTLDAAVVEEQLATMPGVIAFERNQRVHPISVAVTPNDTHYARQWGMPIISAPYAWSITTGSRDVVVAVLDSGVYDQHDDIGSDIIAHGYNFVADRPATNHRDNVNDGSHGTMVAGIIGARTNNGRGVAGLNWSVSLMPIRVINSATESGSVADVGRGIRHAVDNGAHIINMSLAWKATGGETDRFVSEQIEYAAARGVIMVAGAGNDNKQVTMPAAHPQVIAVGAIDHNKQRAWYSNYGNALDLVAPGGGGGLNGSDGIYSTDAVRGAASYRMDHGTSFAAPHVTGVVALMYSAGIRDAAEIRDILRDTAEDLGPEGWDPEYGYGLVNAYAAVAGLRRTDARVGIVYADGSRLETVRPERYGEDTVAALESLAAGRHTVYAWIDVNRDGVLDAGDFAAIAQVDVPDRGTVSVDLDLAVLETLPDAVQQQLLRIVNR